MARVTTLGLLAFGLSLTFCAVAAEPVGNKVTVLAREKALELDDAFVDGDDLWVPGKRVVEITGFELKPEGLCAADICIQIPKDSDWLVKRDGETYFNVTAFARSVDQVYAADARAGVWSFTAVPRAATNPLQAGDAPDFALPDRNGKTVKLSDYRGKKVLLLTWASWCGCRHDLAGWQKVYDSLKDKNFEIIAAAQDTGGPEIAAPWYDKAHTTFTSLVDANHTVSTLYQMVNVPTGVWIDEQGKIVRPSEVAYSKQQHVLGQDIGDNRYAEGVRDWVERGEKSPFATPAEKLKSKLAVRDVKLRLADAEFKLGAWFSEHGNREAATRHWQEAQKLSPDNWNYHRQDWSFDKKKEMANFLAKVRALGTRPYYDPVEFPAASESPGK